MAQVVECPAGKHNALSSKPVLPKKKKPQRRGNFSLARTEMQAWLRRPLDGGEGH
jgi:hypothetical protein